jgi:hypothetical protein
MGFTDFPLQRKKLGLFPEIALQQNPYRMARIFSLFRICFALLFFQVPDLSAQEIFFENNRDTLVLKYHTRLAQLLFSKPDKARFYIDSMQKVWPAHYEQPLTYKDKFLVETYLDRPDSAIKWFASPPAPGRNGVDFGCDSGRFSDSICPQLMQEALAKNKYGSLIRENPDAFAMTTFARKLIYFKTPGRRQHHGFGAYQTVNARIFLDENPHSVYRPFVEKFANTPFLPARYRYGFTINFRQLVVKKKHFEYSPNVQLLGGDVWLGINRLSVSLGCYRTEMSLQRSTGWGSTLIKRHFFYLGKTQVDYKIKTVGHVSSSLQLGIGYGRIYAADKWKGDDWITDGNVWDVSAGYRMGLSRGWLFPPSNDEPGKTISWSEMYLSVQGGFLKVANAYKKPYLSATVGVWFGWSKSTNEITPLARKWYRWKELLARKDKTKKAPKRLGPLF